MTKSSDSKIIYGPYGCIGYMENTQPNNLKNVFETFFELFYCSRKFITALF